MGKHQTYRKRGTAVLSHSTLIPCPQPTLENIDDTGVMLAHCTGNNGGFSFLYSSPSDSPYVWTLFASTSWVTPWPILPWGSFPDGYYQPRQQGNGTAYTTDIVSGPVVHISHA